MTIETQYEDPSIARRILSFALVPFLSLLTPFLVLPVVAGIAGIRGWAAIAIGQSIGGLAAIFVAYGWTLRGPVEIAQARPDEVPGVYYESLVTRAAVLPVVSLVVAAVASVAAPQGQVGLTVAVALSAALGGMAFGWVAIGLGRASILLRFDVAPRVVCSVLTLALLLRGADLMWYPVLTASPVLVGLLLFSCLTVRPRRTPEALWVMLRRRIAGNSSAAATMIAGSAYSTGAILLVGLSTTIHQTALMSSADRLYKLGLFSVIALTSAFQAWVVHESGDVARARQRVALRTHTALGVLGLAGLGAVGPTASRLLFGPALTPGYGVTIAYGVAFACLAPASCLAQHFLVPAGDVRGALFATIVGVAVGVPALVLLGHRWGAVGAASALALSELVVLLTLARRVSASRDGFLRMSYHRG